MLKPEYNRRATIIEGLRAECFSNENNWFFGYPRSTIYDVLTKYTALEQANEGFSIYACEEESLEKMNREDSRSR